MVCCHSPENAQTHRTLTSRGFRVVLLCQVHRLVTAAAPQQHAQRTTAMPAQVDAIQAQLIENVPEELWKEIRRRGGAPHRRPKFVLGSRVSQTASAHNNCLRLLGHSYSIAIGGTVHTHTHDVIYTVLHT